MLAYDRRLCTLVLGTFVRALLAWHRRRARDWLGCANAESGTVTVIQRFGSSVNLNVHFHVLALDGVYAPAEDLGVKGIHFHALPAPETAEVAELLAVVTRRIFRVLVRSGRLREEEEGYSVVSREELENEPSALASCQAASIGSRIALGPRAGKKVRRLGDQVEVDWANESRAGESRPRCAERAGFSLHADVWVGAHDRKRLERLCRYIARPAIATERLSECVDGRIVYGLRRPWRDGTRGMLFEPGEFIEKLVALVPAPRGHSVRYHGVLAAHSRLRAQVVRDRGVAGVALGEVGPGSESAVAPGNTPGREAALESGELRERKLRWSQLMLRVFETDVLKCSRCGGRRELIAVITQHEVIVAFLSSLGLPTRAPPMTPAREVCPGQEDPGDPPPF